MWLSNRLLLGLSAAAAALALVGTGTGASFTDSATAGGSVTLGYVRIDLGTGGTGCGSSACNPTYTDSNGNGRWKDWPYTAAAGGFTLGSLNDIGSHFHALVPLRLTNTGDLTIRSLRLVATDPQYNQLEKDTMVTVTDAGGTVFTGSLAAVVAAGGVDLSATVGAIPPKGGAWVTVSVSAPDGGYRSRDVSQTMAPTFTATASDL